MEAPKKVQIGLKINDYDDWEIQGYSFLENKQAGMAEYTRTDAFIEKACKFLNKELPITDLLSSNMLDVSFKVFDKESKRVFIEDFKKYMKGGEE